MRFGVSTQLTADSVIWLAKALEERGYESLFVGEHSHIPAHTGAPFPPGEDRRRAFAAQPDPFVVLSAAAAVTRTLIVGTAVCLVAQRDPIITAKEVASLDVLSGGRFVFGVGAGWIHEEMRNHGTDPATRADVMRERVLAMKEIWANDEASFHGAYVDFDRIYSWPKPVQQPHPPVLIGGSGRRVHERILEYGDGWLALYSADLAEGIGNLRRLAVDRGRGPVAVTVSAVPPTADAVERLAEAGVERIAFDLPQADESATARMLDRYAEVAGI